MADAIGLSPVDADAIGRLVRWHLLLPEVATRRDLGDPQTVRHVADTVGDIETLELLHALSRADAVATGPAAWSAWKERLVADLVARVRAALVTGVGRAAAVHRGPAVAAGGRPLPAVEITPDRVVVAAADRLRPARRGGRLPDPAPARRGLGRHRHRGRRPRPVAVVACRVQPRDTVGPDRQRLAADLRRALLGELDVSAALAARVRSTSRLRGGGGREAAPPRVVWASSRRPTRPSWSCGRPTTSGLLYRVAHALELAGANVRSARISTLGSDVVDAFYLVGDWSSAAARSTVESAVLAAAQPS